MGKLTRRNLAIYAFCLVVLAGMVWFAYCAGDNFDKAFGPKGFIGIEYDESLIIVRVLPNSPAESVGLQVGDKIVSINGVKPITQTDVYRLISKNRPGSRIKFTILRKVSESRVIITFGVILVKKPNE